MTIIELLKTMPQSQEVVIFRQGGEYPDFEGYAYDAIEALDARGLGGLAVIDIETHRYDHIIYIRLFSKLERLTHE